MGFSNLLWIGTHVLIVLFSISARSAHHALYWHFGLCPLRRLSLVVSVVKTRLARSALISCRSFQAQGTRWFVIFSGAILGVTAALLWSAQGSIMMSYPLEKDKGKAFGIFWAIFQGGTLIGSVIALAINIKSGGLSAVPTSTYIVSYTRFVFRYRYSCPPGVSYHHLRWSCIIVPSLTAQPCGPR